uniref:Exportin-T n=3 Tax=Rhodosorus marinus TaxID=101924 RepID=A0A7S0BNT6_9RHOD|mmetsp:Transcript_24200/g.34871  ORF Transcript_24200/g.34871 Transcript_24200/m.34871 type:complete len:982 (+) Transcript_24200:471-3416(+)
MDDFEKAILLSLNPLADKDAYQQATQFVANVESAHDGWRFCVERLAQSGYRPETRFWFLQVILKAVQSDGLLQAKDRDLLRTVVVQFIAALPGQSASMEQTFVVNKSAQLFAELVGQDYPETWPRAFQEGVIPLLGSDGGKGIPLFFSLLQVVDDDLTSKRAAELHATRSVRVKDAMRGDCIEQITSTFTATLASNDLRLMALALDAIRRYSEWVDIQLVVTETLVGLVHQTLGQADAKQKPLTASVAAALRAILAKGMPPAHKLELLKLVRVEDLLKSLAMLHKVEDDVLGPEETDLFLAHPQLEIARLVNQIAMVAIECMSSLKSAHAAQIAESALPAALRLVGEDDDPDVTAETMEFINHYIRLCAPNIEANLVGVTAVVNIVMERSAFPTDYNPFDETSTFSALRSKLMTLFKNIVRAAPGLCISSVRQILNEEYSNPDPSPARAELAYALLNRCQLVLASMEIAEVDETVRLALSTPLRCLEAAELGRRDTNTEAQRTCACFALFTVAYHAHRIITTNSDMLLQVLSPYFDERGLRHPTSSLHRSKTADFLLKFLEKLRAVVAQKYLSQVVYAIIAHVGSSTLLTANDTLLLYETLGQVLGFPVRKPTPERSENLGVVLQPLIRELESSKSTRDPSNGLFAVAAFSRVAKGFSSSKGDKSDEDGLLNQLWRDCLNAVTDYYLIFQDDAEVNRNVVVFAQTMVDTSGNLILLYIKTLVSLLLRHTNCPLEMKKVLDLVNQLGAQFKEDAHPVINEIFTPVVRKTFDYSVTDAPNGSEEARERQELRRTFFHLVHGFLTRNLHAVLTSPENRAILEVVVSAFLEGASGNQFDLNSAPSVIKLSFQTLTKMVSLWTMDPSTGQQTDVSGFREFVVERLSGICISAPLESQYFLQHGFSTVQAERALAEIVVLQKLSAERCGSAFSLKLAKHVLPMFGLSMELSEDYGRRVMRDDMKTLGRDFVGLLQELRKIFPGRRVD